MLIQEIAAASNQQRNGTHQINTAIQQLDQVTQQNALISEKVTVTSQDFAKQAEQLRQTIHFFTSKDDIQQTAAGIMPTAQEQQPAPQDKPSAYTPQ